MWEMPEVDHTHTHTHSIQAGEQITVLPAAE